MARELEGVPIVLVGIHPLLIGSLLAALDGMGHGDVLVVADANFPARRGPAPVVDIPTASAPRLVTAVRTVFPLDPEEPLSFMTCPDGWVPVQRDLHDAASEGGSGRVELLDRYAFYDLAAKAQLLIRTGELRAYGNVALRKGVIPLPGGGGHGQDR